MTPKFAPWKPATAFESPATPAPSPPNFSRVIIFTYLIYLFSWNLIRQLLLEVDCNGDFKRLFGALFLGFCVEYGSELDPITVVEKACKVLKNNVEHDDCEEAVLDWDDYCLDRAYVEVVELGKEKSLPCRTDALPRV